ELLGDIPDTAPGPAARYEARESVSLAFVAALQHLTPGQRTALVLRDVLGFNAAEAADILGASLDSVNGSLKRARAAIGEHLPAGEKDQAPLPGSAGEHPLGGPTPARPPTARPTPPPAPPTPPDPSPPSPPRSEPTHAPPPPPLPAPP